MPKETRRMYIAAAICLAMGSISACTYAAIQIQYGDPITGIIIIAVTVFVWIAAFVFTSRSRLTLPEMLRAYEGDSLMKIEGMGSFNDEKKVPMTLMVAQKGIVIEEDSEKEEMCYLIDYPDLSYRLFPKRHMIVFSIKKVGTFSFIFNGRMKLLALEQQMKNRQVKVSNVLG